MFGKLYIGKNKTEEAHSFLILSLNLAGIKLDSYEVINLNLNFTYNYLGLQ